MPSSETQNLLDILQNKPSTGAPLTTVAQVSTPNVEEEKKLTPREQIAKDNAPVKHVNDPEPVPEMVEPPTLAEAQLGDHHAAVVHNEGRSAEKFPFRAVCKHPCQWTGIFKKLDEGITAIHNHVKARNV